VSEGFEEGDYVIIKKEGRDKPGGGGADKYSAKAIDEVFMIGTSLGLDTFKLKALVDEKHSYLARPHVVNTFHATRLVKVTLPPLEDDGFQKYLEISEDGDTWLSYIVKQVSPDGRVKICPEGAPHQTSWVNLTKLRYRWVTYRGAKPVKKERSEETYQGEGIEEGVALLEGREPATSKALEEELFKDWEDPVTAADGKKVKIGGQETLEEFFIGDAEEGS
jgi:hypothetical protein